MTAESLLAGIRDANFHEGGIRCLRLLSVDTRFFAELVGDIEKLCRTECGSDVNAPQHVTNWTRPRGKVSQFSLLNGSGRYDDFSVDHDPSCLGKKFQGAADYPALASLIAWFPHTVNFRINVLGPHSHLSAHEEHSVIRSRMGCVVVRARFHLPIVTNEHAEVILDDWVYHLEARTVYFVNHGCIHSARNRGNQPRIHLVWDSLLTRQVFERVFDGKCFSPEIVPIESDVQTPPPSRSERQGACLRIPAPLSRESAESITWCEVQ